MVNWEDTGVLEAKIAPLEEWAAENADNADCEDSIELIGLMTRRMRRNPANAATSWKQLLAEQVHHDNWPIGGTKGPGSNLNPAIRAFALEAKAEISEIMSEAFGNSEYLQYVKMKRPRNSDPLFHTADTFGAAAGQAAYTAIVNLSKAGFLTVEGGLEGVELATYDPTDTDGDDNEG